MGAVNRPAVRDAEWLNDMMRGIPQMVEAPATGDIPGTPAPGLRRFGSLIAINVAMYCGSRYGFSLNEPWMAHARQRHVLFSLGLRVKHLLRFANDSAARCRLDEAFLHPGVADAKRVGRAERFQGIGLSSEPSSNR